MARSFSDVFLNASGSGDGLWLPHTSSIDFCETNYLLTIYIAECHNVWSSIFGLTVIGLIGMFHGNPLNEKRVLVSYVILAIIGVGSSLLHASLHWAFQSFDELPMIYLVLGGLYSVLEVDAPRGTDKYGPKLPRNLVMVALAATCAYYKNQQNYLAFLTVFNSCTVILAVLHCKVALGIYREWRLCISSGSANGSGYKNRSIALWFWIWHLIVYLVIASSIWVVDQFACDYLLPYYNKMPFPFRGCTLHVVWHIAAGFGAHLFVQFLVASRLTALGYDFEIRWFFLAFPTVVLCTKEHKL